MTRRKYTRGKEEVKGYECCNRKCKWQGQDKDRIHKEIDHIHSVLTCPNCGKEDFYGLREFKKD